MARTARRCWRLSMNSGVQGSASSWISQVHASWLSPSAVTFRAYAAFPLRRCRGGSRSVRCPRRETLASHSRCGNIPVHASAGLPGQTSSMVAGSDAVQISRPPAPPAPLAPTACRDTLGTPVGLRDHGQHQDAERGQPLRPVDERTRTLARRLHDQRAHGVPGAYRKVKRPFPPPAAPTLS
jgi:hypothetical protein